jgi:transcriptional regulator with XRE-family HTH domain
VARANKTAEDLIASIGLRVAELREALDLTQQELADLAGMQLKDYQRIELGKRNITLVTLVRVADALNVAPACLFDVPASRVRRVGRPRKRANRAG